MKRIVFVLSVMLVLAFAATAFGAGPNWPGYFVLTDSEGFHYRISLQRGSVYDGFDPTKIFDQLSNYDRLYVNGAEYLNPSVWSNDAFVWEMGRRELALGEDTLSSLGVSRKIYVPEDGNFVRFMDIYRNASGGDVTVNIQPRGYDSVPTLRTIDETSDGDSTADLTDSWFVMSSESKSLPPPFALVWNGVGAINTISAVAVTTGANLQTVDWDVTIPDGETWIFMTYLSLGKDVDSLADTAAALADGTMAGMFAGISNDEAGQIRNWGIVNTDTDADGMRDWWEDAYGLDKAVDDSATDTDGDGLSNLQEFLNFTDPSKTDTDGDGLADDDEITKGTDPLYADSDDDGVTDGAEATALTNALDHWDGNFTRITNDPDYSDMPDVAVDSSGNIHMAFTDDRTGTFEIYYKLLDKNMDTLINTTQISNSTDGYDKVRVDMELDSTDRAYVVWHQSSVGDHDIYMSIVEPTAAMMNGSAAEPLDLLAVNSIAVSNEGGDQYVNPSLVIDSSDNAHIVWEDYSNSDIGYTVINSTGGDVVADKFIMSPCGSFWHAVPSLDLDSAGNVHIVWADYCSNTYETFYAMLNATDGVTLIDATMVSDFGMWYASQRATVTVDSGDNVNIVYHGVNDNTSPYQAELYFMKLDPSLDDQDGSTAYTSTIRTMGPKAIVGRDAFSSGQPTSAEAPDGNIHVTWYESIDDWGQKNKLHHMVISPSTGSVISNSGQITNKAWRYSGWTEGNMAFGNGKVYIVYADSNDGYDSLEVALYSRKAAGAGGGGGGGGGGGCFIATAAYGSYSVPDVMALRRFRDEHLMTNPAGRALVSAYYRVSPPVADFIASHGALRAVTRIALKPVVYSVKYPVLPVAVVLGAAGGLVARRRRRKK